MSDTPQRIVVPAYFALDGGWSEIEAAGDLVSLVVAGDDFFLGLTGDPDALGRARDQFDRCRGQGQRVFGYVDSGFGWQVDRAAIDAKVAEWYDSYPDQLDGIFFDNGPSFDPDQVPSPDILNGAKADDFFRTFYTDLIANGVGSNHPGHNAVAMNCSLWPNDWILTLADHVNVWEGPQLQYRQGFGALDESGNGRPAPDWWTSPKNRGRISNIIYDCCDADGLAAVVTASKTRSGHVYVLDEPTATYPRLPTYWEQEKAAVAAASTGPEPFRAGASGQEGSVSCE